MENTKFDGRAIIKVRFKYKIEYEKFRKYILKTDWTYGDFYPVFEELKIDFHSVRDLNAVTKTIVMLLQMGFEVYSCQYKLEEQLAEEEYPPEGDEDDYDDPDTTYITKYDHEFDDFGMEAIDLDV